MLVVVAVFMSLCRCFVIGISLVVLRYGEGTMMVLKLFAFGLPFHQIGPVVSCRGDRFREKTLPCGELCAQSCAHERMGGADEKGEGGRGQV